MKKWTKTEKSTRAWLEHHWEPKHSRTWKTENKMIKSTGSFLPVCCVCTNFAGLACDDWCLETKAEMWEMRGFHPLNKGQACCCQVHSLKFCEVEDSDTCSVNAQYKWFLWLNWPYLLLLFFLHWKMYGNLKSISLNNDM